MFESSLETERRPLDDFFNPRSIVIIGASTVENSAGHTLVQNLTTQSYQGKVYLVSQDAVSEMAGLPVYQSVTAIAEPIDLAIIVNKGQYVLRAVRECITKEIKAAVITAPDFYELGDYGQELRQQILKEARAAGLRIIGPSSQGVMNPKLGLNATLMKTLPVAGTVGFISQSGAFGAAVLDRSLRENVGFSAFVSTGTMLDVDWGDLIYYLGNDYRTKSIIIYMEAIGNARSFLSAAREVALTKPIIVLKMGRTEAAAQFATQHAGTATGHDEVLNAAFRRIGVLRVTRMADLFYMAETFSKQPRPRGSQLTIVTNAWGPGTLAADSLIAGGGQLTKLSNKTIERLNEILPQHWNRDNPLDILGNATADSYAKTIEILAEEKQGDGLLVILTPQTETDPVRTAQAVIEASKKWRKPLLASWMGGQHIVDADEILNAANIPTFAFPDTAARTFNYMWRYNRNVRSLYETPQLPDDTENDLAAHQYATEVIEGIRQEGRTILTEYEAKVILAAYNIPVLDTRLATTADEAAATAEQIGYPVVLKLHSHTVARKTDVGGVHLNLLNAAEVRQAFAAVQANVTAEQFDGVTIQPMLNLREGFELLIGSYPDPQFGPVLQFGTGGLMADVFDDITHGLPPLTSTLARRMMERTKIYQALQRGASGRAAVDLEILEGMMVRLSQLVAEQPWIKRVDINPFFVSQKQMAVLDVRIHLYPQDTPADQLTRLAIRPYPTQYIDQWTTKKGLDVTIRPIRPEDEPLMVDFHGTLSEKSVYLRYFQALNFSQRISHERLTRLCFIDYDREMALVAEYDNPQSGKTEILAVARLTRMPNSDEAEYAGLVSDKYHGQGLGTEMLKRLINIAHQEKIEAIVAYTLPENTAMRHIFKREGFVLSREHGVTKAELTLRNGQKDTS